jgi:hypothetical protein
MRIVNAVIGRDRRTLEQLASDPNPVISGAAIHAADDLSGKFHILRDHGIPLAIQWNSSGTPSPNTPHLSAVTNGQTASKLVKLQV